MAPATTGGASRAARKSQPTARVAQGDKRTASRSTPPKKRAVPAVKGTRTGEAPKRSAAHPVSAVRGATSTAHKVAARHLAPSRRVSSQSSAKQVAPSGSRRRAGSPRGDAETTTTKAARSAAAKAKVKTVVTSTSPATKETKKRASVAKAAKPQRRTGAPATSRSAAAKTTAQAKAAPERRGTERRAQAKAAPSAQAKAPLSAQAKPAPERKAAAEQRSVTGRERKSTSRRSPSALAGPYAEDEKFLTEQRQLLEGERAVYLAQASDLKAEADSLAQEREPGDVQFDEESGEGGTVTVDRERDLALSAQALAAVEEIDAALEKIVNGTYGVCERCLQPIPKPRLKALPYARLCVACKSGGLSRR